jgi:hemoglobin
MQAIRTLRTLTFALIVGLPIAAIAGDDAATLYERLGGWAGINSIVSDTIAAHRANPEIAHYFEGVDVDQLEAHVTAFFAAGSGGPDKYAGRDMTTTHSDMGLSDADFDSAVADVLAALDKNGVGPGEKAEVAAILESLRPAVMGTASPGG